jgi:carbon-monoxide dehydrogenase large subunit
MKEPPHPALAQGKVRHVGDPVPFVIARAGGCRDAAAVAAVDYENLPPVITVRGNAYGLTGILENSLTDETWRVS